MKSAYTVVLRYIGVVYQVGILYIKSSLMFKMKEIVRNAVTQGKSK